MKSGFELCMQLDAIGLSGKKKRQKETRKETRGKKEEHPSLNSGRFNPPRH